MSNSWLASERFGLAVAPGGTALVQDFLNTKAIGDQPDLLADPALAQIWVTNAVQAWSETRGADVHRQPTLAESDVAKLQALRASIAGLATDDGDASPGIGAVSATFVRSKAGEVRLEPAGTGWRWLASALWGEIVLSQQCGTWGRLKQCRNPDCRSTFYDRSKNNSGVWHNVKVCGNAANLRASRARRRERTAEGHADRAADME
jgi:CGNR zinc finger